MPPQVLPRCLCLHWRGTSKNRAGPWEDIAALFSQEPRVIGVDDLRSAEAKFTHDAKVITRHGDLGGDRMGFNGYAPIYAKYLPHVLGATAPAIAEVGILAGTGLAMWTELFPKSKVFGFDINTATYESNIASMKQDGFQDSHVNVTHLDQQSVNASQVLKASVGDTRLSIVTDDGMHVPETNVKTFKDVKPLLAERFVYFIEDVYKEITDEQPERWATIEAALKDACAECDLHLERPESYENHVKTSRVVVLTRG